MRATTSIVFPHGQGIKVGSQSDPPKPYERFEGDSRRGVANRAVDRLKRKLLDLSLRNRLLNFRHSVNARNHVRLIDEVPEFLFGRLEEGATLAFKPVDLPEQEPEDERKPEFVRLVEKMQRSDKEYIAAKAALGARPRKIRVRQIELDLTRFGGRFSYAAFFTECISSNLIGLL